MIGIYLIKNDLTDECYIGQSKNIEKRFQSHRRSLKDKKYALYSDMRAYGLDVFTFSVIEECRAIELDEREMFWIKDYQRNGYKLYNIIGVPEKESKYAVRRRNKARFNKYK